MSGAFGGGFGALPSSMTWKHAGLVEMLLHNLAGVGGVVGADGAVDLAMHLGGLFEALGALNGLAAAFVEVGGDGLHEGAEDGVAGGTCDGAVEADVVDEVLLRVVEGGVHLGDFFGELGEVLVGGALGGEGGEAGLEDEAGLEHLPREEAVESSEDGEGTGIEGGWAARDEGAGSVTAFEDAHGGEEADAGAEAGAGDFELAGEFALGREAVAGVDLTAADEGADVLDDLHGQLAVIRYVVVDRFFHANCVPLREVRKEYHEAGSLAKLGQCD